MANIQSSFVDAVTGNAGAAAPNGASVLLTPGRVLGLAGDLAGSDPALLHTTVQRQLAQIVSDTLGADNCAADQVVIDYDDATGFVTDLEFLS